MCSSFPPTRLKSGASLIPVSRKTPKNLFLGIVYIFLLYGLRLTSAVERGIITSTVPTVLGIISFIFLKEQLTLNKGVGITLTVPGILAVNVLGSTLNQERGALPMPGNLRMRYIMTLLNWL